MAINQSWRQDALNRLKDDLGPYKLKMDTGTVYGEEYYTVQPVGWMHSGDNHTWHQMVGWCVETFGPTTGDGIWTPSQRWYVNNAKFWFKDIKDRDWFIMRWS
jgi:hypothetical protein